MTIKLHPETNLPDYPRGTHGVEGQLVNVGEKLASTTKDLRRTVGLLEDTFTEAFEVEERRQATRDRINALAAQNSNSSDIESQHRARLSRRG